MLRIQFDTTKFLVLTSAELGELIKGNPLVPEGDESIVICWTADEKWLDSELMKVMADDQDAKKIFHLIEQGAKRTEVEVVPDHDIDNPAKIYMVQVQWERFVSVNPLTKELEHVGDASVATKFSRSEAETVLAKWIDGEKSRGVSHVGGEPKIVLAKEY